MSSFLKLFKAWSRFCLTAIFCLMPVAVFAQGEWVGSWSASPQPAQKIERIQHATLRQIVKVSLGGTALRIHFSNAFGMKPLKIDSASFGAWSRKSQNVVNENSAVLFSGFAGVTIKPGEERMSDPIKMRVVDGGEYAISLFFKHSAELSTFHSVSSTSSLISKDGNFASANSFSPKRELESWYLISELDVKPESAATSIVCFGDSITDGVGSEQNRNTRYPDFLARRIRRAHLSLGVLNAGIGFNRILETQDDIGQPSFSALERFDHDVLSATGVSSVIILEGINDIGLSSCKTEHCDVGAMLVVAYRKLIERAHRAHLRAVGATLTPIANSGYDSPAHRLVRDRINTWIRESNEFDAVVDFDRAVRRTQDHQKLRMEYDSGDHLHLNSAGYRAMAESIDLSELVSVKKFLH